MYDGIGFPDEAYRYVDPPPGTVATPLPSSTVGHLKLVDGVTVDHGLFGTDEQGPQVVVEVVAREFASRDATETGRVDVTLQPVRLVRPPTDGTVNSNDYRIGVNGPTGPLQPRSGAHGGSITLREADFGASPVMEFRASPNQPWRPLRTSQAGRDIFTAPLQGAGDYVLVIPTGQRALAAGASHRALFLALGASGLLLVLVLVGVRMLPRENTP